MKRLSVVARLLPLAGIALFLALSSCRSPVQGSAGGSLSLSLSIPADLASDVPEPIRRAIGEAELAGSRPRFIHPDGKTVKAAVTKADGSEVGSATASLEAGASSATLTIADLPLNEALTLTVGVYDAGNSKVGERVVGVEPISASSLVVQKTVSIPPLGTIDWNTDTEPQLEFIDGTALVPGKYYIVKFAVPSSGLYKLLMNSGELVDPAPSFKLYDSEGLPHNGFHADIADRAFFGSFGQLVKDSESYFLIFQGVNIFYLTVSLVKLDVSMLVSGFTSFNTMDGNTQLITSVDTVSFGVFELGIGATARSMPFTFYNAYDEPITIRSNDIAVTSGEACYSSTPLPSAPVPPGSKYNYHILYFPEVPSQGINASKAAMKADGIEDFIMSFAGETSGG